MEDVRWVKSGIPESAERSKAIMICLISKVGNTEERGFRVESSFWVPMESFQLTIGCGVQGGVTSRAIKLREGSATDNDNYRSDDALLF